MNTHGWRIVFAWLVACVLGPIGISRAAPNAAEITAPAAPIGNHRCLRCHADPEERTWIRPDGTRVNLHIDTEKFDHSVHAKQACTGCHTDITKLPHAKPLPPSIGCIECHRAKWDAARQDPAKARLGVVVAQMESYLHSVHAKPNKKDMARTNAACHDCHDAHDIGTLGSSQRAEFRLRNPEICGRCHAEERQAYLQSVHGRALTGKRDAKTAVCSDCHTTHAIASPQADPAKLKITENCGNCHQDAQRTYFASYHGQVNRLGFANTAKCHDCHGGHGVRKVDDPASSVHANNRLKTCNTCHKDAGPGFLGFHAHGDADDFERYPGMYLVKTFMEWLIYGVMLFFWTHVVLWFWREYLDRRRGLGYTEDASRPETVYFRRFSPTWRWIHLLFAVSTMVLVLTGTTLLFSHTDWAKAVMALIGGPKVEAIIHRTAATVWLATFLTHVVLAGLNIWRNRKDFRWFGPTSLIPNLQDLRDIGRMFAWFFGRAPRPNFDRWTYWQKFDYWAPFWGAAVIGFSGLMLFLPARTADILPGWVFNIATIVHAEEALLATVFLFTVHFFNVHFRPDKFPLNTAIFTGVVPLEEFKHEHGMEYARLQASGELERHLVRKPSRPAESGATALATILIFAGLALLTLVLIGYTSQT